ncbi:MAG: metal-dependent transcriptional regulator [Coriobacteriia bacterium]|nr:metal-dependent transcriptional regulator [Coriobacteriia bacterium]
MPEFVRLSQSHEDYLEAIYKLSLDSDGQVKSIDLAHELDVSKASVNKALNVLKEHGYVEQSHYGKIHLTKEGELYGESMLERHSLLSSFLIDQLGVSNEVAAKEACQMEHAISEDTMQKWLEYLRRCQDCEFHRVGNLELSDFDDDTREEED